MGRKPHPITARHFERGAKLDNNSNRYSHTCRHCGQEFVKGRIEVLHNHLTKCAALSQDDRIDIINELSGITSTTQHVDFRQDVLGSEYAARVANTHVTNEELSYQGLQALAEAVSQQDHVAGFAIDPILQRGETTQDHTYPLQERDERDSSGAYGLPLRLPQTAQPSQAANIDHSQTRSDVVDSHISISDISSMPTSTTTSWWTPTPADSYLGQNNGEAVEVYTSDVPSTEEQQDATYVTESDGLASIPTTTESILANSLATSMPQPISPTLQKLMDPQTASSGIDSYVGDSEAAALNNHSFDPRPESPTQLHSFHFIQDSGAPLVDSLDLSASQQLSALSELAENSASSLKSRKKKAPYSEAKKQRTAEMRKVGSCIKCGRLGKLCDIEKPCSKCVKVKEAKNWIGPCTTLNKGQEFDIWYKPLIKEATKRLIASCTAGYAKIEGPQAPSKVRCSLFSKANDKSTNIFSLDFMCDLLKKCEQDSSAELTGKHMKQSPLRVGDECLYVTTDSTEQMSQNILREIQIRQDLLISTEPTHLMRTVLSQALKFADGHSFSDGTDAHRNKKARREDRQGDQNLASLIEMFLIVHILTSPNLEWRMKPINQHINNSNVIDLDSDSGSEQTTSNGRRVYELLQATHSSTLSHLIQQSQKHLYRFDSRLSEQKDRALHNITLGAILILCSIERYSLYLTQTILPQLPPEQQQQNTELRLLCMEQGKTLAEKYIYAIRNVRMLPRLKVDSDSGIVIPRFDVDEEGSKIDHSLGRELVREMALNIHDLKARERAPYSDQGGPVSEIAWDGFLWARIFLTMLEA